MHLVGRIRFGYNIQEIISVHYRTRKRNNSDESGQLHLSYDSKRKKAAKILRLLRKSVQKIR